jgi:hypothetical protein
VCYRDIVVGEGPREIQPTPPGPTYLDTPAFGALKDGGVTVSTVVDDAHLSTRANDPGSFTKCLGAFFATVEVGEGQASSAAQVAAASKAIEAYLTKTC